MRKNANNLMDIYYKKSEFLVDGLKNNIEISQKKQQLEATQAIEATRDQLKVNQSDSERHAHREGRI